MPTIHSIYKSAGNRIAEHDDTGTIIGEYIWLDGRPSEFGGGWLLKQNLSARPLYLLSIHRYLSARMPIAPRNP